jgi:CubicO group peptidase (beta-lactamase class C family)
MNIYHGMVAITLMGKIWLLYGLLGGGIALAQADKMPLWNALDNAIKPYIQHAIANRVFPGAVVLVGKSDGVLYHRAFGKFTYDADAPRVTCQTVFDVASITKFVACMPAAMLLYDAGALDLYAPVARYIPDLSGSVPPEVQVRHLLTHTSGLIYNRFSPSGATAVHKPGTVCEYTCGNMILLKKILDRLISVPFDVFVRQHIYQPLGMSMTGYRPIGATNAQAELCAPTACRSIRATGPIQGVVHDDQAYAMAGVAGNSGIFSTAYDLYLFAQMLLRNGVYYDSDGCSHQLIQADTIARWTSHCDTPGRGYGCEIGRHLGLEAYGHFGWTGTSLWIDPSRDLIVVLLTNRSYLNGSTAAMRSVREAVHDAIWAVLGYPPVVNRPPPPALKH